MVSSAGGLVSVAGEVSSAGGWWVPETSWSGTASEEEPIEEDGEDQREIEIRFFFFKRKC